jgi:hypothetical protein
LAGSEKTFPAFAGLRTSALTGFPVEVSSLTIALPIDPVEPSTKYNAVVGVCLERYQFRSQRESPRPSSRRIPPAAKELVERTHSEEESSFRGCFAMRGVHRASAGAFHSDVGRGCLPEAINSKLGG